MFEFKGFTELLATGCLCSVFCNVYSTVVNKCRHAFVMQPILRFAPSESHPRNL